MLIYRIQYCALLALLLAAVVVCGTTAHAQIDTNVPPTLPQPVNVRAAGLEAGGIRLEWDYDDASAGAPIDKFVINRSTSPEGANATTHEEPGTSRSWVDRDAELKKVYYYRVTARRGAEQSIPAGLARATTFGSFVIKAPGIGVPVRSLTPDIDWTPAGGGGPDRRYDVTITEKQEPKPLVFEAKGLLPSQTFTSVEPGRLRRNREYALQVTAIDPGGVKTAAANGPVTFSTPGSPILGWLQENHFSLRRAFDGDDASKSAQFSYSDKAQVEIDAETGHQDTTHTESADFLFSLSWAPPLTDDTRPYSYRVTGLLNAEGKLSNQDDDADNAMRVRGGLDFQWFSPGEFIGAKRLIVVVKHEGDQDYDTHKLMAEITARATIPTLAIGIANDLVPKQVRFIWTPSFVGECGHTLDQLPAAVEADSTVLRLIGRVQGRLSFPTLARDVLGVNDVAFFADNKMYYLPLEDDDFHNYLQAGFEVKLTDNVSVDLTYKIGEDSPNFLKNETLGLSFGVQF